MHGSENPQSSPNFSVDIGDEVILTSRLLIAGNWEDRGPCRALTLISWKHQSARLLTLQCAGKRHHCPVHICCESRCLATAINAVFPLPHFPED